MSEMYPFFVYGTLRPGQVNACLWAGYGVSVEEGVVLPNGRLYSLGAYPMLVEGGEALVRGALLTVPAVCYDELLARFDWLEGVDPSRMEAGAYRRLARRVLLTSGRWLMAWVYVGRPDWVVKRPFIPSGDWIDFMG